MEPFAVFESLVRSGIFSPELRDALSVRLSTLAGQKVALLVPMKESVRRAGSSFIYERQAVVL